MPVSLTKQGSQLAVVKGRSNEVEVPPMPESLDPTLESVWADVCAVLAKRGALTRTVLPLIEAYVASTGVVRMGSEALQTDGLIVEGRVNPVEASIARASGNLVRISRELKLENVDLDTINVSSRWTE